jgi:hypothetical protein
LERETGIEPATFSLGNRLSFENKQHGVFAGFLLAIEYSVFSIVAPALVLIVFI